VITGFNDKAIEGARDLTRAVADMRPGTQASIKVYREGRTQDLSVAVSQRSDLQSGQGSATPGPDDRGKRLGVSLAPLSDPARRELGLQPGESGVLVQQVEPNSPASENGIKPGDVIVSANNRDIRQPSELGDEWAKARQQNRPVLLRVRRDGQYLFLAVAA
jgi:serine protease Do